MDRLARFIFTDFAAAHDLRGELTDFAPGSKNLIPIGNRQHRPFKGLDSIGTGARRLTDFTDADALHLNDLPPLDRQRELADRILELKR